MWPSLVAGIVGLGLVLILCIGGPLWIAAHHHHQSAVSVTKQSVAASQNDSNDAATSTTDPTTTDRPLHLYDHHGAQSRLCPRTRDVESRRRFPTSRVS